MTRFPDRCFPGCHERGLVVRVYATLVVTLADHGNGWRQASVVIAPSLGDRYLDHKGNTNRKNIPGTPQTDFRPSNSAPFASLPTGHKEFGRFGLTTHV